MYCCIWCSALVVMAVVMWSWATSCVHCVKVTVRTVPFTVHTARIPAPHNHSHHNQCRTPYAAVHTLVLLMIGIMMPETCRDKSLIINIRLVASRWFLCLHPTPVCLRTELEHHQDVHEFGKELIKFSVI